MATNLVTSPQLPALMTLPNVDILATGTWGLSSGEATFTAQDLANAVQAAQCPAVGSPVLKLGHIDPTIAASKDPVGDILAGFFVGYEPAVQEETQVAQSA